MNPLSRVIYLALSDVFTIVLITLKKLVPFAIVVACLFVFGVALQLLLLVSRPLGLSDQLVAGFVGVCVLVGFWVAGLKWLSDS